MENKKSVLVKDIASIKRATISVRILGRQLTFCQCSIKQRECR